MNRMEAPTIVGGAIFFVMFASAIVAEVGGHLAKEQVSLLASWSLIPVYGGFFLSGLIWLRSRRHQGSTLLKL